MGGVPLNLNVYFRDACEQLMKEEGCGYSKLPLCIAKKAKSLGLSASKQDLTCSIQVPKHHKLIEAVLAESGGRKPEDAFVRQFLRGRGLHATESMVEKLVSGCIKELGRAAVETARGTASLVCQNPTCSKPKEAAGKRQFCGKCQRAAYCSKGCQETDWRRHKQVCVAGAAQTQDSRKIYRSLKTLWVQRRFLHRIAWWLATQLDIDMDLEAHCRMLEKYSVLGAQDLRNLKGL